MTIMTLSLIPATASIQAAPMGGASTGPLADTIPDGTASARETVTSLMAVMHELTALLREENDLLRRGMPAQAAARTNRKVDLSNSYTELMMLARYRYLADIKADPGLREPLLAISHELDGLSRENLTRLEAAMQATRRRIESVMKAIKVQDRRNRPYGADGQNTASRVLSHRANYRI